MAMFNSYVSLPEGIWILDRFLSGSWSFASIFVDALQKRVGTP